MVVLMLLACDPYAHWPEAGRGFPWETEPLTDLEPYEEVRFETETWTPFVDLGPTGLYALKAVNHRPGAPLDVLLHFGSARPGPLVANHPVLSFAGDIMRMESVRAGYAEAAAPLLDGVLRIGNLETPVSTEHTTNRAALTEKHGVLAFNAPTSMLESLPFDVLQLNNNHSLDLGVSGFTSTAANVGKAGFDPVGFDRNQLVVDLGEGIVVGLLSYTWGSNVPERNHREVDVSHGHVGEDIELDRVRAEVAELRSAGVTHAVLLLHWGFEYEYWPDPHFLVLGRELVAAGADVIVGHGPHVPQAAELCAVDTPSAVPGIGRCSVRSADGAERARTAAILYSLGNFGTDQPTIPLQTGIVGSVSLDPAGGVSGLGWEAVARGVGEGGPVVVPLDDLVTEEGSGAAYAEERARLDQVLGTSWKRAR